MSLIDEQYAVYCQDMARIGGAPESFDVWMKVECQRLQDENSELTSMLTFFVCNWPASAHHNERFDALWKRALALTGMIDETPVD